MYLTQKEIWNNYKVGRSTLLMWEEREVIKEVIKLPLSSHRRYLKSEIEAVLGIKEDC